jgi:hypothetical protein
MSTVNISYSATQTTARNKSSLLSGRMTLDEISQISATKVDLARGQEHSVTFEQVFCGDVSIPILIQIENETQFISFTPSKNFSSLLLPFRGRIIFSNPSDNSIILPAKISYIAI